MYEDNLQFMGSVRSRCRWYQ